MENRTTKTSRVFAMVIYLVVVMAIRLQSQGLAGLTSDPLVPVFRSIVNPGFLLHTDKCIELNFLTASANVQNNMYYLEKGLFSLSDFIENPFSYSNLMYNQLQFFENTQKAKLNATARLQGPSIIFNPTNKYSFFLTSAFRFAGNTKGVPSHLAYLIYEGIRDFPFKNQWLSHPRSFVGSTISWTELGGGVAFDLTSKENESDHRITFGVTANTLFGYHGIHIRETDFEYRVHDNLDIEVQEMNIAVMSASPYDIYGEEFSNPGFRGLGRGISFSAGVVFEKKIDTKAFAALNYLESYVSSRMNYKYRLGISLTDVGAIRFDREANRVELEDARFTLNNPSFNDFDSFDHLLDVISDSLRGGDVRSFSGEEFVLGLPSTINVQFDYNLGGNFFAHLFLIQDLPFMKNRVASITQIGFVPRYDFRQYSFAIPITMNQFSMPRIGAYARIGFFSIGTDSPGGWLGLNDFSSFDLYFSFNIGLHCPQKSRIKPCKPWN